MQIFVHRTCLMQRITRHICNGYHHYVTGTVPADKAVDFCEKFTARFRSTLGETQRWKDRKAGRAATYFLIHPSYSQPSFDWWLLMTDGDHPARNTEKHWRDLMLKRQHLILFNQYEAVRIFSSPTTAEAAVAAARWSKTDNNNPPWTWRMTDHAVESYRTQILDAIRRRRDPAARLKGIFIGLTRVPGFRQVRDQVYELHAFARAEWRRTKANDEPVPVLPPVGPWVRFQKAPVTPLAIVASRLSLGLPPYAAELVLTKNVANEETSPVTSEHRPGPTPNADGPVW